METVLFLAVGAISGVFMLLAAIAVIVGRIAAPLVQAVATVEQSRAARELVDRDTREGFEGDAANDDVYGTADDQFSEKPPTVRGIVRPDLLQALPRVPNSPKLQLSLELPVDLRSARAKMQEAVFRSKRASGGSDQPECGFCAKLRAKFFSALYPTGHASSQVSGRE